MMANLFEDIQCAGKDNGVNILKSIDEGPFKMEKFRETLAEGALYLGQERDRVFADLTLEEKERFKADIRVMNILLQGLPKDIYTLINHYTDAKDILDNVKMLLEGSELTKDERESLLYDKFEHFCQNKGETIHEYHVRGAVAAGNSKVQNRVDNANPDYFEDKMLLMQAQENGVVLDEEQLLFIVGGQAKTFDDDMDETPVKYLALDEDNIF
nr:integrase, catalytic region, zinc finger, CCHC-type, peptidase aspartic, catalytic [Tanacetum cinerariifolium]